MIFVLPILLYPLLGISIVKFTEAFAQKPRTAIVIGTEFLPTVVPLLNAEKDGFDASLFDSPDEATKLVVRAEPAKPPWLDESVRERAIRDAARPRRWWSSLPTSSSDSRRRRRRSRWKPSSSTTAPTSPARLRTCGSKEFSRAGRRRSSRPDSRRDQKPASYTEPIDIKSVDIATDSEVGGSVWSRLFPFLLVMMSLTGAFYPAIDLCAGEKERGTMETLLISPASRAEIVMGKFLTVVLASMMTALLNLVSMGLTGIQLANQVSGMAGGASANAGSPR